MTIDEFLIALEKTPRDWEVRSGGCPGALRRGARCDCPITAVAGERLRFNTMNRAGYAMRISLALGLSVDDSREIICAADGVQIELRLRLLAACGLVSLLGDDSCNTTM